jgi:hypothetical protein
MRTDERNATSIERFFGTRAPTPSLLKLESRGWTRGEVGPGGASTTMSRSFGRAVSAELSFEPGIVAGSPLANEEQVVDAIKVRKDRHTVTMTALDEVTFSEIVRDLTVIAGLPQRASP